MLLYLAPEKTYVWMEQIREEGKRDGKHKQQSLEVGQQLWEVKKCTIKDKGDSCTKLRRGKLF